MVEAASLCKKRIKKIIVKRERPSLPNKKNTKVAPLDPLDNVFKI